MKKYFTFILLLFISSVSFSQTFDQALINDIENRSLQLLGKRPLNESFSVRTIPFNYDTVNKSASIFKPVIKVLPISFTTQYNTRHPFGGNDGSMIAAKGLQTRISGGIQIKTKFIEAQLAPEIVWAANSNYPINDTAFGYISGKSFQKAYIGQSTIQFVLGNFKAGISTANQWWGPGVRNSLLMTYNAPGFMHIFIGSRKPMKTPIGYFEWKLLGGLLNADSTRSIENTHLQKASTGIGRDKRYLNSLVLSYQPKWVPGLFLGFTRSVQTFENDTIRGTYGSFQKFLPVLALAFQKKNIQNEELIERDQLASFFLRWILPKNSLEFYIEYGYNDYKQNIRDYLMGTSHSAANIVGLKKIFKRRDQNKWTEFNVELTKMSQTPDYLLRNAGNWYVHGSIIEGYTNDNQILGSNYGYGADAVFTSLSFVNKDKRINFFIEHINRDPVDYLNKWVDLGIGIAPQIKKDRWILSGKFEMIQSNNYSWQQGNNVFNFHIQTSIQYQL